jgi:hypothetical protein
MKHGAFEESNGSEVRECEARVMQDWGNATVTMSHSGNQLLYELHTLLSAGTAWQKPGTWLEKQ